jgi:hypothetical protein
MRLSAVDLRQVVKRGLPIAFVRREFTSYKAVRRYLPRLDLGARLSPRLSPLRMWQPPYEASAVRDRDLRVRRFRRAGAHRQRAHRWELTPPVHSRHGGA